MSAWYVFIEGVQRPFDAGQDSVQRAELKFNVDIQKRPSNDLEKEIASILQTAGVGTWEDDIFASSAKTIPDGDGPYLVITDTGGAFDNKGHNTIYAQASVQISVRARLYATAKATANAAYNALIAVENQTIVPV